MGAAPVSHGRRPLGARSGNEGISARRVLTAAAAWEGVGVTSRPLSRLPQCGVFIMTHRASHGTEAGSARGRGPRAGGSDHAAAAGPRPLPSVLRVQGVPEGAGPTRGVHGAGAAGRAFTGSASARGAEPRPRRVCFLWLAPAPSASGSVLKPPPAPGRVRAPWAASATRFLGEGESAVSFHMVTVSDRDAGDCLRSGTVVPQGASEACAGHSGGTAWLQAASGTSPTARPCLGVRRSEPEGPCSLSPPWFRGSEEQGRPGTGGRWSAPRGPKA